LDLKGKKVAIFGLGDQKNYPDNFVDGMGILADAFQKAGAELVGFTSTDGYTFNQSRAVRGEKFCGLVIDQENQAQLTSKRIADWCKLIKEDFTSNKKE
jgi:flavodoxin fldA